MIWTPGLKNNLRREKNMNERYKHTQIGTAIIITTLLALIFFIALLIVKDLLTKRYLIAYFLAIELILLILFSTLNVRIEDKNLIVKFGIGVIKRKFNLDDIESCKAVKNTWYYTWGIKIIPNGWLFAVSGFKAVELKLRTGKIFRVGTDEPQELEKAINKAIGK